MDFYLQLPNNTNEGYKMKKNVCINSV